MLASDGVPVTVKDDDTDIEVPKNTIIQSPWTLTEGVKIVNYLDHESDEPLLKVTITRFTKTGSTAVGLCSSHLIGTPITADNFMRAYFPPRRRWLCHYAIRPPAIPELSGPTAARQPAHLYSCSPSCVYDNTRPNFHGRRSTLLPSA